jgi:hypothetical protein
MPGLHLWRQLVGLNEVVREVEEADGMAYFTLGTLRDAYLADHPDLGRQKLSEGLVQDIRKKLGEQRCLLWPEEMDSHREDHDVYVINLSGKVGTVLKVLRTVPDPLAADALREFLDKPSQRPDGQAD